MTRSSGESFPVWKALVIVLLLIELVVIVMLVANRDRLPVPVANEAASAQGDRAESADGAYAFDYPDSWQVSTEGSVTKLLSPGNEIAMAIGPAPSGDVLAASDRLIEGLASRYDRAITKGRELTRVGGNLGLTVSGTAINEFGREVTFAVVTFEGDGGNYAITSFAAGAEDGEAERALQEVVSDFELVK